MKNDVLFDSEKSLRTNKARLRKLAAFKIAAGERNRESVGMRASRDLAENQIFTWQIGDHQCGPTLSGGRIVPRKRDNNDFTDYRFDHAASSSGEFQSRARTDSLNSAPLNGSSTSFSLQLGILTSVLLRESCSCRQRNYASASQRRFRKNLSSFAVVPVPEWRGGAAPGSGNRSNKGSQCP